MADDKDKRPKEPFNLAAKGTEIEVIFESEMDIDLEDDDEPLRGNTDPKHDPENVKNPSLTPSGTGNYFPPPRAQDQGRTPSQPENTETPLSDEEWQHALRNGNHTFEGEFNGFRVRAWRADQPTDEGIHKGHLTEMVVTQGDYGQEVEVAHFKTAIGRHH